MRQYKKVETTELDKVFATNVEKKFSERQISSMQRSAGDISQGKDNEVHEFDLCEECYDAWISDFSIPVEKK